MAEPPTGGPADGGSAAELERLRAERDRLQDRLAALEDRRRRGGIIRRVAVGVLVVLSVVAFVLAGVGVFARRNFLDTERWVQRVGPLSQDPAVEDRLTVWLTGEVTTLVDPEALFEEVLPDRGQILAVPLANAVEGFVADRIGIFVRSDRFDRLWEGANRRAHAAAVRVLEGDSELVDTVDGRVVLNLVPVINAALAEVGQASPTILGRDVDIPTVTVDDVPEAAISRLEQALGLDLEGDFGQVAIYKESQLEVAQDAFRAVNRVVTGLVVLTPVLVALALWLSRRRRRTLLQLLAGFAIGLVLVRRVVFGLEDAILDQVRVEENVPVVQAVERAFVNPFLDGTMWLLAAVAVVALLAVATAPYPWVVSLRHRARDLGAALAASVGAAGARARDEGTVRWLGAHRQQLQIGGAVLAVAVLWFADLSWCVALLVIALLAAYQLFVYRIEPVPPEPGPATGAPVPPGGAPVTRQG